MRVRLQLSVSESNDGRYMRTVYADNLEIGVVVPVTHYDCLAWEASDNFNRSHGDRWLTDWYAAEALARGLRLS